MIDFILKELGLSITEAKVYSALLGHGESTTGEILKNANIHTGKIYEILDSLSKKGLVSMVTKSGVKHFSPADPQRILDYLEEKKSSIEKQQVDFQKILPELIAKINQVKKPTHIEVFIGFQGIKNAYKKEILVARKNSTLYDMGILSRKQYDKKIYDLFTFNIRPNREKAGFKIKKLLSKEADIKDHEKSAEIRFLPYGSIVTITAIENLSIIGIFAKEPVAITIENEDVAKSFREQFNLLWKISKK